MNEGHKWQKSKQDFPSKNDWTKGCTAEKTDSCVEFLSKIVSNIQDYIKCWK